MSKVRILELVSFVRVFGFSPPGITFEDSPWKAMELGGEGNGNDVSPYRSMVDFRQENLLVFRASNFRTLKWRWPSAARSVRRFESG